MCGKQMEKSESKPIYLRVFNEHAISYCVTVNNAYVILGLNFYLLDNRFSTIFLSLQPSKECDLVEASHMVEDEA